MMVCSKDSLTPPHAQVIHEQRACGRGVVFRVEGPAEGSQEVGDGGVEDADVADCAADERCGIWWEGGEGQGAFGVREEGSGRIEGCGHCGQ